MKKVKLSDDGYCFACGKKNRSGLSLDFHIEKGRAIAEFIPQKLHQGFKDIVHGGIISTILDEAMMKAVLAQGIKAVTAEITVRFKNPLLVGDKALIEAEINKTGDRLVEAYAQLKKNGSVVIAEAYAKLLRNA
jgi:acyl-coenzyme A thioesterase PaaI-like protein